AFPYRWGIIDEIGALLSDELQVVPSTSFPLSISISSRCLFRYLRSLSLLQEFVERHGDGLEVVYSLSEWLNDNPLCYHIKLVSGPKLTEAKEEFDGECSVQVYNVQTCTLKDPAALWNAEFVQAEELFSQDATTENCLRDNRFCAVANPFVSRSAERELFDLGALKLNGARVSGPSNTVHQKVNPPQPRKIEHTSQKKLEQPVDVLKDANSKGNGAGVHDQASKLSADTGKVTNLPASKKLGQNSKNSSTAGGSLANLWGRASTTTKSSAGPAENSSSAPSSTVSAEAQICAHEAAELNSDDEGQDVNVKRTSKTEGGRKRRVVFDFSYEEDENEDAVNLASADFPKAQSILASKESVKELVSEKKCKEDKMEFDEVKVREEEHHQPPKEDVSAISRGVNIGMCSLKGQNHGSSEDVNNKRRKLLKTRTGERGREVTEVVWEGEEELKKANCTTVGKSNDDRAADTTSRFVLLLWVVFILPYFFT
ncbi:hypothetical protein EUGRSUZ_F01259, partial [Eucalyptus grandis]